jgi:hypothetical protein
MTIGLAKTILQKVGLKLIIFLFSVKIYLLVTTNIFGKTM